MPEVAAGSALLVDPFSEREIRDALLRLLTTPDLRAELGRKGRAHALANYRWEIAARQSWEFFERVVGKG
jgi:glycosyltransferase involved in cell wall biosynthesis